MFLRPRLPIHGVLISCLWFGTSLGLVSCNHTDCGYFDRLLYPKCGETGQTLSKTKKTTNNAACSGSGTSKKLQLSCLSSDATFCMNDSTGSSVYAILLPENGSSSFTDSSGVTVNNCAELWADLTYGFIFNDIAGVYYIGDTPVTCDDTSCTFASTTCFSTWDKDLQLPSGKAASLSASTTSYKVCAFIDSAIAGGGLGITETLPANIPAVSSSAAFGYMTSATPTTLVFNTWYNY